MPDDYQIINVPLKIPNDLIAAGAIDLYAQSKGYNPEIVSIDENGDEVVTPNPKSATDFSIEFIRGLILNDFVKIKSRQAQKAAADQVKAAIDSSFSVIPEEE